MKSFIKAWAIANLLGALLVSPLVIHHALTSNNAGPLEEPTTSVDHWEDYKQSKWY
jgi:hypothetical protein